MRRHDVDVRNPSASARTLAWTEVSAVDLDPCTHRPADYNAEEHRRMFDDPAPCARCAATGTSFPQLLDTGETGLRWLPLCAACTDAHLAHLSAIVNRMYGPSR